MNVLCSRCKELVFDPWNLGRWNCATLRRLKGEKKRFHPTTPMLLAVVARLFAAACFLALPHHLVVYRALSPATATNCHGPSGLIPSP